MKTGNDYGSSAADAEGERPLNEETARKMEETGQSCARTRAQKRKLSFKENCEFEVSFSVLLLDPVLCILVTEVSCKVVLNYRKLACNSKS